MQSRHVRVLGITVSVATAVFTLACSSASKRSGFETDNSSTEGASGGPGNGTGFGPSDPGKTGNGCTQTDPKADFDKDGFTIADGDCNDCDPNVNPGAMDVKGNGLDEDCSGKPDDEETECDGSLPMAASDAMDGARAIGLCKQATDDKMWGVVEARWVKPDGSSLPAAGNIGYGVLTKLGINAAQAGATALAISSGAAREPGDPAYKAVTVDKGFSHGTPPGYPKESPSCGGGAGFGFASGAHDGAALQLKIRVPTNAKSFSYQQNFFTNEFPVYICDDYNDFFVTMMEPKPAGLPDGNIAFDQDGNPISVNNSLLQVCSPQSAGGKSFSCPLGNSTLQGTGFENHAATGWLTTKAPVDTVRGKVITLTWAIWDQGDHALDSTALIDDFQWSAEPANGAVTAPTPPK
ncbi:MAG: putative metal-binding motif-containing protein [Deltaproteobacteria bacterium]|nr:putative metal-binding motif-containing protein [Deltaproteobacteria bacterium]